MFKLSAAIKKMKTKKIKPSRLRQFKLKVPFLGNFLENRAYFERE
jgi:hypothetical protein